MTREIAYPENFFRLIHPANEHGGIVLERSIDGRGKRSSVTANEAEKVARISYQVPGVYFSAASFSGMPLLTNFVNANSLYLVVDVPDFALANEHVTRYFLNEVYGKIEYKNFPLPTVVTFDGKSFILYWVLEQKIAKNNFHMLFLLQEGLKQYLSNLNPKNDSLRISSLIPLVGTINPNSNQLVVVFACQGVKLNNRVAEFKLLGMLAHSELDRLEKHSVAVLELLKLFNDRTLSFEIKCSNKDWLLFFGASLSHFCPEKQLVEELKAIAVSLENKRWNVIASDYIDLIRKISATGSQGVISDGAVSLPTDNDHWFEIMRGRLKITDDEVSRLGLPLLSDGISQVYHQSDDDYSGLYVGVNDFIPLERLMMRQVA